MRIAFLGDVMLGRLVNEHLAESADPAFPWGDTLPVLADADLRIGNLECVLSDDGTPWPGKVFHFRSATRNAGCLTAAGIDIVSLANNHVLDYGTGALEDMLGTLDRYRIGRAGAGRDEDEARRPAYWRNDEATVGFIAVTDNEPGWVAGPGHPGVHYVPVDLPDARVDDLLRLVRQISGRVDLLIVSAHWGGNWGRSVPAEHRVFAHAMIDAGAGVVYGHSPHIVRAVEVYRSRPIIYSAGDFVDDYAVDPVERNDQTFVFVLETSGAVPRALRLYPTRIVGFQARLAGAEARPIARRLEQLNAALGTPAQWLESESCLLIRFDGAAWANEVD
ncbi:CapA family protein [Cryobacterium sp. TMT4-10]|uniref:CapA family protein n=1 Tax=Cryobacterium sp. TMT4-10 TaxID=1259256 RepID=UPI00106B0D57|nr:CapA family protein [Cryobacterium sp. TMT4-10]TFD13099.1 CapA family protein [Cryobacterium sp. TMT4-10]